MSKRGWLAAVLGGLLIVSQHAEAQLIISEFRWRGTGGVNDELVEIYNSSNSDVTVNAAGSSGFALVASDGVTRFIIPNGTVIPARGHYLGCNSGGYSLANYPAGNGATATCDATYMTNISGGEDPDGGGPTPPLPRRGIALFRTANAGNFTLANRLDALGPSQEPNTLYKEGAGVRNLDGNLNAAYAYVRRLPGGCIGTAADQVDSNCASAVSIRDTGESPAAFPQDTNDNRADFIFVEPSGVTLNTEPGPQARVGAPGPENLTSPIVRNASMKIELVDPNACISCSPNQVRDLTSAPPSAPFGSLFIRRKIVNNTGANVTRLRFRIEDITTFPAGVFNLPAGASCADSTASCAAELWALTSSDVVVALMGGGTATVRGTTLEQASGAEGQPNGGGYNSSLSANTITLATPLPPVDDPATPNIQENAINVQFRLGVRQDGVFRFGINVEVLP
jgi:hypothetical protein